MNKPVHVNSWDALRAFTDARIALGRTGASLPTGELLKFGLAHAQARDAVHQPFDSDTLGGALQESGWQTLTVHSQAADRTAYLSRPIWGGGWRRTAAVCCWACRTRRPICCWWWRTVCLPRRCTVRRYPCCRRCGLI